ncbi:hypothetical protein AUEXF2481DRAFT_637456 [Aureobasidium subglaciale EXF-2481]|uniref:Uncharacterized protein n=1 Tax=Aureobasidium subglaciale (strain EXF-2481) TaxID=1043005 RepID=A0A074YQN3_AURSE|nr:uncharacterized protein AUEXF2481DRAFT_637456 [Aureobasidium subglaciale EXF-2481]KEQ96422.1 hypothetical protein AUEXF2481DRAFT_637456 [Aureobasidium subglaciale EXF-2481]
MDRRMVERWSRSWQLSPMLIWSLLVSLCLKMSYLTDMNVGLRLVEYEQNGIGSMSSNALEVLQKMNTRSFDEDRQERPRMPLASCPRMAERVPNQSN